MGSVAGVAGSLNDLLNIPFYESVSVAADTPYYLPVSIGAHSYLIDLRKYSRTTIASIRPPSDQSDEPGEQSLTQEGLWRRSQSSWHMGAGQEYFDDAESLRQRFWTSKGLDIFTKRELKLLKDTVQRRASVNTNLKTIQVGTRLYIADGNEVYFVTTPDSAWTGGNVPVAATINIAEGAQSVRSITTDGGRVWAALGANGVHETTAGASTSTHLATGTFNLVGYANERLLAANNDILYEISRAGVATEIWNHPNPSFVWEVIAEAPTCIYVGGTSVDRSTIYAVSALDATGALSPPILAATLPDGETIKAITYYGGAVVLGTSRGIRIAFIGSNNSLSYGPAIEITGGVNSFEGQGEYVWFTYTNYDGLSTGLGRLDLSRFTRPDQPVPAYASDLMASGQGSSLSVATVGGKRYFAISGLGFYGEDTNLVASGVLDTGRITWGTTEKKIATSIDLRHESLPAGAKVSIDVETEEGTSTNVGSSDVAATLSPSDAFGIEISETEAIKVKLTINRQPQRAVTDGVTTNTSVVVTSATAAFVSTDVGRKITGTNIPAGATIASINSATSANLSTAATGTGTGITFTLGDATLGPEVRRWTLFARVAPVLNDEIIVPLIIHDKILSQEGEGLSVYYDTLAEFQFLQELAASKTIQRYQEGITGYNVYVSQVKMEPEDWNGSRSFFNGTIHVRLVTL